MIKRLLLTLFGLVCFVSSALAADFDEIVLAGPPFQMIDAGISASNFAIDSSTDTVAFIFQCAEPATITKVGFRYGARTGTIPANAYKVVLEGVSTTTGDANGTDKGGGSPTAANFSPPSNATWDGTFREVTLTNSYTCTRGEIMALAIRYNTGTIDASNNSSFTYAFSSNTSNQSFPYSARVSNGGAATKDQHQVPFMYASASKYYGNPLLAINKTTYSGDSSPDEYGLAFQIDCDWDSTFSVKGFRTNSRTAAGSKTIDAVLYSNTTVLQDVTIDSDQLGSNTENGTIGIFRFNETSLSTLSCDTEYIIGWKTAGTGEVTNLVTYEVSDANYLQALPGGIEWYLKTRTDAGAWTSVTTQRPAIDIIIGDWTPPAGGGSDTATGSRFNRGLN